MAARRMRAFSLSRAFTRSAASGACGLALVPPHAPPNPPTHGRPKRKPPQLRLQLHRGSNRASMQLKPLIPRPRWRRAGAGAGFMRIVARWMPGERPSGSRSDSVSGLRHCVASRRPQLTQCSAVGDAQCPAEWMPRGTVARNAQPAAQHALQHCYSPWRELRCACHQLLYMECVVSFFTKLGGRLHRT